jgi:hypothetical protein
LPCRLPGQRQGDLRASFDSHARTPAAAVAVVVVVVPVIVCPLDFDRAPTRERLETCRAAVEEQLPVQTPRTQLAGVVAAVGTVLRIVPQLADGIVVEGIVEVAHPTGPGRVLAWRLLDRPAL